MVKYFLGALVVLGLTSCASMQADLSAPYCEVVKRVDKVEFVDIGDKMERKIVESHWVRLPEGCRQRPATPPKFQSGRHDRELN